MRDETLKHFRRFFAIKWVIFAVLTLSIFFYFGLTVVFKKMGIQFVDESVEIGVMRYVFFAVSLGLLFASLVVRQPLTSQARFLSALRKRNFKPEQVERFTSKMDDESVKIAGSAILLSNMIDVISWALLEAVAILGIILFFLSDNVFYVQAFGGASLIMMALFRPNFSHFIGLIEAVLEEHRGSQEGHSP